MNAQELRKISTQATERLREQAEKFALEEFENLKPQLKQAALAGKTACYQFYPQLTPQQVEALRKLLTRLGFATQFWEGKLFISW